MYGAGGAAAAAAAAKKRRALQKEEEQLTQYRGEDLEGWEFKILRSATGAFKNRETVEKVRQEEAQAGWEMVEKFDNNRIRFKRRIDRRTNDRHMQIDPYRTSYGIGEGALAVRIVLWILVGIGLLFGVLWTTGAFN